MVLKQKRNDTKIENISGLPTEIRDKYRSDTQLGTVLENERVVSLSQLKKKFSED